MSSRNRISVSARQQTSLHGGLLTAVRVLRLDAAGLTALLQDEAATNPALVLDEAPVSLAEPWPRWHGPAPGPSVGPSLGPDPHADLAEAPGPSLMAHVMATVDRLFPTGPDRAIALTLAEGLEPSGWLSARLDDVARVRGVPVSAVAAVLARLQVAGSAGLFARSLAECLRLQLVDQGITDPVVGCMVDHLDMVAAGQTARLAALCSVPEAVVLQRLRILRGLNPKPGTLFDADPARAIREPDLLLRADPAGGWQLTLNRQALPDLRILPGAPPAQTAAARTLARMVGLRGRTLMLVGEAVVQRQTAACATGLAALRPMTMADIAAQTGLHATTVSRVVAGASIDTPHGLWLMRSLFAGDRGGDVSAAGLRSRLAALVAAEDRGHPLSDEALARMLSDGGAQVARRTVAKYRAMQNIAPAHRRRQRPAQKG